MYTGAVKVMFGAIPGVLKAEYHYKMPNLKDFTNMLVDICTLTKPVLSIIDGVVGMEGEGPTGGTPVESGIILASENPFELDVAGAYLMGIKPLDVPTVQRCRERGLVSGEVKDIEISGEDISKFVKHYRVPDIGTVTFSGRVPKFVEGFLNRNVLPRPVFSPEVCIGCQSCKNSCPPGAITMVNGKPAVNLQKCIRCFCCQELCPQKAVEIKRPWVLRRLIRR
jgi:ferredoxin